MCELNTSSTGPGDDIHNMNIFFFFVRLFSAVEGHRWSHASQVLMSIDRGLEHGLRSF